MRELMRSVARANMRALGRERINQRRIAPKRYGKSSKMKSYFAEYWREYVHKDALSKRAVQSP